MGVRTLLYLLHLVVRAYTLDTTKITYPAELDSLRKFTYTYLTIETFHSLQHQSTFRMPT